MSVISIPSVRVGEPVRYERISLFPLFGDAESNIEYRLADEALADESLLIEEVSEAGSVPELIVENKGEMQVLFLEGQELVGAKQNRILNTSVLIGGHSKVKIPVSCVEQGRWGYRTPHFASSGSHSPSSLRHSLKASVTESLRRGDGHRSDQGEVWNEVEKMQRSHQVASPTMAMSDTFDAYEPMMTDYREKLPYVEGATGLAVVIGGRLVSMDVFDKPHTCEKVWKRLISGTILESLQAQAGEEHPQAHDVESIWEHAREMSWEEAKPVGEGEELRASGEQGEQASALLVDGTLVHGSLVVSAV